MAIRTNHSHTIDHDDVSTLIRLLGDNVAAFYAEYGEIDIPDEVRDALIDTGAGVILETITAIDYDRDYQKIWKLYNIKKKGNDYGI